MNFPAIGAVAAGGALGCVARYLVGVAAVRLFGLGFPWGTLFINVLGSFVLGAFAQWFTLSWNASQTTRLFLTVGICGGFTTFSTYLLDVAVLIERGALNAAVIYAVISLTLGIAALYSGLYLVRFLHP
ncbi:MAG TPA: fluoride efflux transporter CrcB [Steroidobacteraceae bacterium]|nr:fluoride efflux transporter CrcB [Steroidobacteraceae bacterium]